MNGLALEDKHLFMVITGVQFRNDTRHVCVEALVRIKTCNKHHKSHFYDKHVALFSGFGVPTSRDKR